MSLVLPGGGSRSRSKSPGRRDRDRSPGRRDRDKSPSRHYRDKSPGRAPSPDRSSDKTYKYEYAQATYDYASPPQVPDAPPTHPVPTRHLSYSQPGQYEHGHVSASYADPGQYYQPPPPQRHGSGSLEYANLPPQQHAQYAEPGRYEYAKTETHDRHGRPPPSPRPEATRHLSLSSSGNFNLDLGGHGHHQQPPQPQYAQPAAPQYAHSQPYAYGQPPTETITRIETVNVHGPGHTANTHGSGRPPAHHSHSTPVYASPGEFQYARPDERINYKYNQHRPPGSYVEESEDSNIIEVRPGGGHLGAPPSPGLGGRMHRLSVSGGGPSHGAGHHHGHGGLPPGSPMLEAYHGTYQSISPMPSPMALPASMDDGLDELSPLSGSGPGSDSDSGDRRRRRHQQKRVKFYDPEDDAKELSEALRHRTVDAAPLIEVLPALTHEQMLELRTEYKKHAKMQGKGINIAKHIKMKCGNTAFGTACYATALGQWESEAYWANFWYQKHTSKRELLIESLMGRTNAEIREIKDAFSDKRYNDSLERCMKAELKADKFRTAVLLVLEEKRMEESKYLRADLVREDVRQLHESLRSKTGGETAMIEIIVTRSDTHLREVLRVFEKTYGKNFAKEMLRKSTNLVGETLAHVLNGLINRPVRDALLLNQAISAEASKDRTELLISRLVRYHWERPHLERVKHEYRSRYGKELATALAENTLGEFGEFCVELVIKR